MARDAPEARRRLAETPAHAAFLRPLPRTPLAQGGVGEGVPRGTSGPSRRAKAGVETTPHESPRHDVAVEVLVGEESLPDPASRTLPGEDTSAKLGEVALDRLEMRGVVSIG